MPRYDYRCERGHRYELQQPFGSPTEHPCERCGSPARRVLHAGAVVFKGSGWYKTDSRSTSSRRVSSSSSNGTKSEPASESTSDSNKKEKRAEKNAELATKTGDD